MSDTPGYAAAVQGSTIIIVFDNEYHLIEESANPNFMELLLAIGSFKPLSEIQKILAD